MQKEHYECMKTSLNIQEPIKACGVVFPSGAKLDTEDFIVPCEIYRYSMVEYEQINGEQLPIYLLNQTYDRVQCVILITFFL